MISFSPLVHFAPSRWSVAAVIVILAGAGYLKWNAGLMPEHVFIPNPTLPSPNARDIYNRAESMLRDTDLVDALPRLMLQSDAKLTSAAQIVKERRLVAENLPALTILHQGLQVNCLEPAVRSWDTPTPYYEKDWTLSRLLTLKGQLAARGGDWNAAISDEIEVIQFGVSTLHGATDIGCFSGLGDEKAGREQAWSCIDHLSASQAEAAAKRLADIDRTAVPYSSAPQQEQWFGQASMLEMYRNHVLSHINYPELAGDSDTLAKNIGIHLESPRVAYGIYTKRTNEAIRRANLPWPEQQALKPQTEPTDPVNSVLFPLLGGAAAAQRDNTALNEMLETDLALRAYQLEHRGASPSALKQLVPAYLLEVPTDPFSDGQPLRYRLVGGKPLLYSIGPDAVDNGGLRYKKRKTNYDYMLKSWFGDVVAGKG